MEDAAYRRDEYQEVASGMWGCRGTRAGARQYSKQQFVVGMDVANWMLLLVRLAATVRP